MGELLDRVKLNLLVNGNGIVDNFKNNSLFFYQKYHQSDMDIKSISVNDISSGGFYFFHYMDDSNWMKWSPVFVVNYKKLSNKIVLFAINFNFIPLEIRVFIFDKFISKNDFEKNNLLKVDYEGVYNTLRELGFEYAFMEFDALRIQIAHKISLDLVPRFLYAQHPKNIYDPNKLMQIWSAKIEKRDQRHKEIMMTMLDDFYDLNVEISDKYVSLKSHIQRIRTNMIKYGNQ